MDWFYEGVTAALWQIGAFIGLLVLAAAGMWSCNYLGVNPGYGILSFYVGLIISVNLFLSWKNRSITTEVSE